MESSEVLNVLTALAKHGRLETYRVLLRAGQAGLTKTELMSCTHTTAGAVTQSVKVLKTAGLLEMVPEGRIVGMSPTRTGGDFHCRALSSPVLDMVQTLGDEIVSASCDHATIIRPPDRDTSSLSASAA